MLHYKRLLNFLIESIISLKYDNRVAHVRKFSDQEMFLYQYFLTANPSLNKVKFRAFNLNVIFYKTKNSLYIDILTEKYPEACNYIPICEISFIFHFK